MPAANSSRRVSMVIQRTFLWITAATLVLASMSGAVADPPGGQTPPPPPAVPPFISPPVFCFRITDITDVPGDVEGNAFDFEFEVLNWTNAPAFGLDLSRAAALGAPTLGGVPLFLPGGSSVDPNGRPGGPADDEANFSPLDGTVMPPKFGAPNLWGVGASTATDVGYLIPGPGIPSRDVLGVPAGPGPARTAAALALVPSESGPGSTPNFVDFANRPNIPRPEVIDNGGYVGDALPDNVQDGFVMRIDDFDPGENISINWFLKDSLGAPLGTSGGGNAYGFGNFNVSRAVLLEALWRRKPNDPFGPGQNRGAQIGPSTDMFTNISNGGTVFATEFGAALTAPFMNPGSPCPSCGINAEPIPAPQPVNNGFDVFRTAAGQTYIKSPFSAAASRLQGVPLSDAQFQSLTGVSAPGLGADTIVRRMGAFNPEGPSQQQVPIQIVALSLQSVQPIDLGTGHGLENLSITLAPVPQNQGILAVDFDRMTFTSLLPAILMIQGSGGTLMTQQMSFQVTNGQFNSSDLSKMMIPSLNGGFLPQMFSGLGNGPGGLQILQTLFVPPTGIPGDYDGNQIVDGNDALVWQRGGSPNPNSSGDLTTWEGNVGFGYGTATAIPEPSSVALVAAAMTPLSARAGRRRTRR